MTELTKNPRGSNRPHDGRGSNRGAFGRLRKGKNKGGCSAGGPGYGLGGGRGNGSNRQG